MLPCLIVCIAATTPFDAPPVYEITPKTLSDVKTWGITTETEGARLSIQHDSRRSPHPWNNFLETPEGLLKGGETYTLVLDYVGITLESADAYFYVYLRSKSAGISHDIFFDWADVSGELHQLVRSFSLIDADDVTLNVGIYKQGVLQLTGLKIYKGTVLTRRPVTETTPEQTPPIPPEPAGPTPFVIEPPRPKECVTVSVAEFGAKPDEQGDSSSAFIQAIEACQRRNASILTIPTGTYRICTKDSLVFQDLRDFVINGQGSTLVYDQLTHAPAIQMTGCTRVVVRNLAIDWDWDAVPLAHVICIEAVDAETGSFDVSFPRHQGVSPSDVHWKDMNPVRHDTLSPGEGQELSGLHIAEVQSLDNGWLRITSSAWRDVKKGTCYLARNAVYEKAALHLVDNTHLTMDHIDIRSFPGMGIIVSGDQHHWALRNSRIAPPDTPWRPIATTADGLHVQFSQGDFSVEHCEFACTGDDGINIHDANTLGVNVTGPRSLTAPDTPQWRIPFHVGDLIEFRREDLSPVPFEARIERVVYKPRRLEHQITFDRDLPKELPYNTFLFNRRYHTGNYIIRDCVFRDNRARGLLAQAPNGLIANNAFLRNQHSAMHIETGYETRWSEGYGVNNVIIRNNRIEFPNAQGRHKSTAIYVSTYLPTGPTDFPVFTNLLFAGNRFKGCPGPVLSLSSTKNIVFRENVIEQMPPVGKKHPACNWITAEHSADIFVVNNTWQLPEASAMPMLEFDPNSVSGVVSQGNRIVRDELQASD